ncbi:MAG: HNH endonuclease [Roseibium sp.]
MTRNLCCILCQKPIPEKTKPEHVLLNALGGRLTTRKVICPNCNHFMGNGPDKDLADSTAFLRNICHFKAGDGDDAPQLRNLETNGERFDLKPGMQPQMRPRNPMDVQIDEDKIYTRISAYSDEEADKLASGAAIKIAKHLGHKTPEVIEAIKQDILKERKSSFRPAPKVHQQLQFGTGRSQQSMAKACLVLWAMEVTNDEVNSNRYDAIRQFINTGVKDSELVKLMKIDTRPLPPLPIEYGNNPNIVWAGCDEGGVYGYFRLYGAIGWRFLLSEQAVPHNLQVCLISNPFDNKLWRRIRNHDSPVGYDWVNAQWDSWPPQFDQVVTRLEAMSAYAQKLSEDTWLPQLVRQGLSRAGCCEGDLVTEQHVSAFSQHVGRAISAYILQKDIPDSE